MRVGARIARPCRNPRASVSKSARVRAGIRVDTRVADGQWPPLQDLCVYLFNVHTRVIYFFRHTLLNFQFSS